MSEAYHLAEWAGKKQGPYVPALLRPLEMKARAVFVDLGCGSGYVNSYVGAHCAPADNIGMDYEAGTIELAKRLNAGDESITWMCASAESIPLPDHQFDTVVTTWTMCSIPDLPKALAEVRRVRRTTAGSCSRNTAGRPSRKSCVGRTR